MKCPHCLVAFHDEKTSYAIGKDIDGEWGIITTKCPACNRLVFFLAKGAVILSRESNRLILVNPYDEFLVYPKSSPRPPAPKEVPNQIAEDYNEACLVLNESPKASAALSRRCLQNILHEKAGINLGNLSQEIDRILTDNLLPSYITESLDAIRNVGNFAAHPIKSESSGQILNVEPGEAEWSLDVIEMLFDFFFVQPAATQKKRDSLNRVLADAGKPEMK